jgi:alkylation response protein AidB-like acyl-CoA dehydrogenase
LRLELDEEQAFLRDTMRASLERESTTDVVRRSEPLGFDADLWSTSVELGLPGMCLSEGVGGGGADALSATIVAVELGRTIAPVPLAEHWSATRCAASLFPEADWLPDVVDGSAPATVALRSAVDDCWEVVPAGAVASMVVGVRGDHVVVARIEPSDLRTTHASAPVADCRIGEVLAALPLEAAGPQWRRAIHEWKTFTSGLLVGVASRALELAVAYALERHQFGRPIGSFQSIQHALADLVAPIDGAWLLASEAAWACDRWSDERRAQLASMAFLFSADAARDATSVAVHVHGGYGVMEEYDIQLYYRRARGWPLILGDPERERSVLGETLFGASIEESA